MTPEDLQSCRQILSVLTSPKNDSINYLFLEPVDTSIFTDYTQYIAKPMDLSTLSSNLDSGAYATKEDFYADTNLIFENAVTFNKGRPNSGFVLIMAKKMSQLLEREKKKVLKRSSSNVSTAEDASAAAAPEKKKIKLTIKRNSISTSTAAGETKPPPPAEDDDKKLKASGKKLKLKLTNRGKQLPEGVQPTSTPRTYTAPSNSSTTLVDFTKIAPMNNARRAQCYKILSGLKRRQAANVKEFLKPVSDAKIVKDYRAKIEFPMDLGTIGSKLDKNLYPSLAHFALDIRRVFSNCFRYNTAIKDIYRKIAMECLNTTEDLLNFFIAQRESPKSVYPTLLYCWEECLKIIHTLSDVTNPDDQYQTAYYFLQDVQYYYGGVLPEDYASKVSKPMSFATITQKLATGCYDTPDEFVSDCRLVVSNCKAYCNDESDESSFMVTRANRLKDAMEPLLEKLLKFDASSKGTAAKEKAFLKCMTIKRPDKKFLKEIMAELRATEYTDKQAKITEMATAHFEKPVDTTFFPDYRSYVEVPMDLETVDGRIDRDEYATPEDFEYDVSLIFKNCDKYNGAKNNIHMVTLGKYTAKVFRKLFSSKLRSLERGGSIVKHPSLPTDANRDSIGSKSVGKKRPLSPGQEEKPSKRVSIKVPSRAGSKSISSGKVAGGKKAARPSGKKITVSPSKLKIDLNAPVPMHVAIASIKESYPGRRQAKDLEGWEADCLKFLKQLQRHPWISAERPKYIFHVPVEMIFPEIREAYNAKIKNPMDLTTAESKLLSGVYVYAEEFVSDIGLIFSNALIFNKDGYEMGEPMSCAYYEASTHLLKYSRWLSLETLQAYLTDSGHSAVVDGFATEWGLTVQNREKARKEMEDIVFNEPIDKTEAGDRYSWSEAECEKLLKSLKHTSDYKHMSFYIEMQFPQDYTAYISKPIAWIYCQDKLRDRRYNSIGELVEDLRLIFANALKYNGRTKSLNPLSQTAYDSALYMSQKLEAAIDKMLLFVSDRIGREKIDMLTLHRETEARERAEEEKLKTQWEKDNPSGTGVTKIKIQRTFRKRSLVDFDFPFFDEGDDNEESHDESLQNAKAIFEQQKKEKANVKAVSMSIAVHVFESLRQRADAKAWACRMAFKLHQERKRIEDKLNAKKIDTAEEKSTTAKGDCVAIVLSADDRKQVKLSISQQITKKKAKKRSGLTSL